MEPLPRKLLTVALLLGCGAFAFLLTLVPAVAPCDSDEANHLLRGLVFHGDLMSGDARAFLRHSLGGSQYPFLHGWYLCLWAQAFGRALFVARASSALLLAGTCAVSALLLRRLHARARTYWLVLPTVFLCLSRGTVGNGVLCMLDTPGMFLMTVTAIAFLRFVDEPTRLRRAFVVGALAAALFLLKYPYGAYILVPVAVAECVRLRWQVRSVWGARSLALVLPVIVVGVTWLALPQTRQSLVTLLSDDPDPAMRLGGRDPTALPGFQLDVVVTYVQALAVSFAPGPVLGALGLLGFGVFAVAATGVARTLIVGCVVWVLFTLTLGFRAGATDRFLLPVVGLYVTGASAGLSRAECWLAAGSSPVFAAARAVLLGTVSLGILQALCAIEGLHSVVDEAVETGPVELAAVQWTTAHVPAPATLLIVGAWDQFSASSVAVEFMLENPRTRGDELIVRDVKHSRVNDVGVGRIEDWLDRESRWAAPGAPRRRRFILLVTDPSRGDEGRASSGWPMVIARARAAVIGARPIASREDASVRYLLYELTDS